MQNNGGSLKMQKRKNYKYLEVNVNEVTTLIVEDGQKGSSKRQSDITKCLREKKILQRTHIT